MPEALDAPPSDPTPASATRLPRRGLERLDLLLLAVEIVFYRFRCGAIEYRLSLMQYQRLVAEL